MDTGGLFKISSGPSRYLERVEKRSLASPPLHDPSDINRDYVADTSPIDSPIRQSPDWEREITSSPRTIDQMTGHRYSPQAPVISSSLRHGNALPLRQTPSPKFSSGQIASPLERVSSPGYQLPPHRHMTPTHDDPTQELVSSRERPVAEPRISMIQQRSIASPQTRMPVRQNIARPQIRTPQALSGRTPRSLQAPSPIRARSSRDS